MSKIIKEIDPRFNKLDIIYSYKDVMQRDKYGSIYYFIPPELVVNDVVTNSVQIYSVIDNNKSSNWVYCRYISKFLESSCNLTTQEYYDLLYLHINDTEYRPKCSHCAGELPWSGRLTWGYSMDSTGSDPSIRFCSYECRSASGLSGWNLQWSNEYDKMYNIVSSNGYISNQVNNPELGQWLSLRFILSKELKDQNNLARLYIVKSTNEFKIGYSIHRYPYERLRSCKIEMFSGIWIEEYVFEGDWKYIAYLEYNLKLQNVKYITKSQETFTDINYYSIINSLKSNKKLNLIYHLTNDID